MIAIWVKARVKPAERQRFLEAIEVDALASERDEAGCHRFNVLQDEQDQTVYYFYEVYKDQAALEAHRAMPHYAIWRAAADTLEGPTEVIRSRTVFPSAGAYWAKARKPAKPARAKARAKARPKARPKARRSRRRRG
jgi:autoinducer 2-degrading protein